MPAPEAPEAQSDTTGETITIPPEGQAFYKGVAAGSRVSDGHKDLPFPDFDARLSLYWFYVGALSYEENVHGMQGEALANFIAGANTRAPQRPDERDDIRPMEDEVAAEMARIVRDISAAVLKEQPDTTHWAMGTDEWDNGHFYSSSCVTATTPTGPIKLDLSDSIDDGDLADLSMVEGGVGRDSEYEHEITADERVAAAQLAKVEIEVCGDKHLTSRDEDGFCASCGYQESALT